MYKVYLTFLVEVEWYKTVVKQVQFYELLNMI